MKFVPTGLPPIELETVQHLYNVKTVTRLAK